MALSQARLRLHAAQAPPCPGVYSFHDRSGKTLYVGKSRNLRQRLASYCSPSALQNPAIPLLLRQAHELRWETTPSELSALLREFERIRLEQPPFNVQGKVARRFGFLRITCERFPRLLPAPWRATDAELWIGPLPDRESAELLLELLQRLYGIRPCSGALARAPHESACLYRELRNCAAPCNGSISAEGYAERLEALRHDARTGLLQWAAAAAERMHALARRWRFEEGRSGGICSGASSGAGTPAGSGSSPHMPAVLWHCPALKAHTSCTASMGHGSMLAFTAAAQSWSAVVCGIPCRAASARTAAQPLGAGAVLAPCPLAVHPARSIATTSASSRRSSALRGERNHSRTTRSAGFPRGVYPVSSVGRGCSPTPTRRCPQATDAPGRRSGRLRSRTPVRADRLVHSAPVSDANPREPPGHPRPKGSNLCQDDRTPNRSCQLGDRLHKALPAPQCLLHRRRRLLRRRGQRRVEVHPTKSSRCQKRMRTNSGPGSSGVPSQFAAYSSQPP
jgi:hypothetical protein